MMQDISQEEAAKLLSQMDNSEPTPEEARKLLGMKESSKWTIDKNNPAHANPQGGKAFRSNFVQGIGKAGADFGKALSIGSANDLPESMGMLKQHFQPVDNLAPAMSAEAQQASSEHPNYAALGYGSGYIAPSLTPIGLEAKLGQMASGLGRASQIGAKVAGRSGEGAIVGGAYNPDDRGQGAGFGAALGAASIPAEKALPYAFNAARSLGQLANKYGAKGLKRLLGAHASADEMQRSIKAADNLGVSRSFGEVAEAPTIKSLESLSAYIPLTGNNNAYMKRGKGVKAGVTDTLGSMNVGESEVPESLMTDLSKTSKALKAESNEKYSKLYSAAQNSSEKVNLSPVHSEFDSIASEAAGKDSLKRFVDDSDFKDLRKDLYSQETNHATGSKTPDKISFEKAIEQKKLLNQKISDITNKDGSSSDPQKRRFLMQLKSSLDESINKSASDAKNPEIYQNLKSADKHYSQEVKPFEESFGKYLRGKKDPDLLAPEFVKNTRYPRNNLLSKLSENLSDESRQALGHMNLTRGSQNLLGENIINEDKALNEYLKMSDKAKKEFFTDKQREILDSAAQVRKNSGLDLKQMVQAKTGEKNAKLMGAALVGGLGSAYAYDKDVGNTGLATYLAALGLGKLSRNKTLQNAFLKSLRASERNVQAPAEMSKSTVSLKNMARAAVPATSYQTDRKDPQGDRK
jgi:hypothetical protein